MTKLYDDYCSKEVTDLLKEKGFKCGATYSKGFVKDGDGFVGGLVRHEDNITHQRAMKWLRENNIIITPQPEYFSCNRCESWGIDIWAFGNYEKLPGDFPKYEEAVEAALKYSLVNLI